jgi:hypothetical protein
MRYAIKMQAKLLAASPLRLDAPNNSNPKPHKSANYHVTRMYMLDAREMMLPLT